VTSASDRRRPGACHQDMADTLVADTLPRAWVDRECPEDPTDRPLERPVVNTARHRGHPVDILQADPGQEVPWDPEDPPDREDYHQADRNQEVQPRVALRPERRRQRQGLEGGRKTLQAGPPEVDQHPPRGEASSIRKCFYKRKDTESQRAQGLV
jgi:hypothetical protein